MKLLTVILFAAILVSFTSKTHQGSVNQLLLPAADTFKFPEIVYKDSSVNVTIPDSLAIEMLLSFEYDIRPYNFSEFRVYRNSEEKIKEMKTRKPAPSRFFSVGDSYPLFETQDINGKQVLLKSLIGKVIVINYWFVACPPCRREMPDLNKLVADYKSDTSIVFYFYSYRCR